MARFRRKPRVVWLPHTDENALTPRSVITLFVHTFTPGAPLGTDITTTQPIVIDNPEDALLTTVSISDMVNSSYRLRRIVGKVWVAMEVIEEAPASAVVTVGFIILKVDQAGQPLSGTGNLRPQDNEQSMDPYIWRRSWLVGNPSGLATGGGAGIFGRNGNSNTQFGSAVDGPHIDQKTARIVGQEERLFMVSQSTLIKSDQQGGLVGGQIAFATDLRVLASTRTSQGNRGNASR